MVSITESADVRLIVEKSATGDAIKTHQFKNGGPVSAGGSPDGVLANKTTDKQLQCPASRRVIAEGDDKIRIMIKLDASDGLDVSDGAFFVPVTEDNGAEYQLAAADFGIATDIPASMVAGSWFELGTGYTVPKGKRLLVGSASQKTPIVISVEDDTA